MFDSFENMRIETSDTEINLVRGGQGPPVLLLHGYPQTHVMWHKIAPMLARDCTVVAADLRGYGDSGKPAGGPNHAAYSFRAMAWDQVEVMSKLGFEQFMVVGHDRGGRVAHRMALDHPERILKVAVLDIAPTLTMYRSTDKAFATGYYHWFFLIQPYDLPERLIGAKPEYYLRRKLGQWGVKMGAFAPEAMAEYQRCFDNPETIHATCEDYRAAAGIDLEHDEADLDRRIECPFLVLWGAEGLVAKTYDVPAVWRERARDVTGRALPCGHFLAEEAPDDTLVELRPFLGA